MPTPRPPRGHSAKRPSTNPASKAIAPRASAKSAPAKSAKSKGAPAKGAADPLSTYRVKISTIDEQLVALLNRRARLVVEVGKLKREHGIPIYTPHREAEVLARVVASNTGPLADRTIEGVFREVMSGSFRLEQPLRIGYLGPIGSYSHVAAVKHFGTSVDFDDLHAIAGVFTEVARAHVDYGLVPIENSIGGGIVETLEAFQDFQDKISIYAEVQIEVHHALLANCAPGDVKRIYSKPEVFEQCRAWLAMQYPNAELVPEASSAAAVRRVAGADQKPAPRTVQGRQNKDNDGIAAIGSLLAAAHYGVNILFENIEDRTSNITRFFVISKQKAKPTGKDSQGKPGDKTSIMFTTPDEPGALVNVLSVFHRAGINLTHIDKRPSGRSNWTYTFFIDAEGHIDDPWIAAAVTQARGHCRDMLVLGSYPRSRRIL
ncbi:MAG: prephenate dehydratase [Pyrinomonadaceae bacterium]|nr:prephenate dehydratase [Phycisphaerales bacterium]